MAHAVIVPGGNTMAGRAPIQGRVILKIDHRATVFLDKDQLINLIAGKIGNLSGDRVTGPAA